MQRAFPPESDIPPVDDEEKIKQPQPTMIFGGGLVKTTASSAFNFAGQPPAMGCVFPRPPEPKLGGFGLPNHNPNNMNSNMNVNNKKDYSDIYAQLSIMRAQINLLNNGLDKMYELLSKK